MPEIEISMDIKFIKIEMWIFEFDSTGGSPTINAYFTQHSAAIKYDQLD